MINEILSDAESNKLNLAFTNINLCASSSSQNVSHSIASIFNLPVEIKQKIAMNLNAKDYASLRESCLAMSQDIDKFSTLSNKIKSNTCIQLYERKIKNIILSQLVNSVMKHDDEARISQVLKHTHMHKSKFFGGCLFIGASCFIPPPAGVSEMEFNHSMAWVRKGLILFKESMSNVLENSKVIIFQKQKTPFIPWVAGIKFADNFICYSQLRSVFINLSRIFNETSGTEKLFIAFIADGFKSFWCENIPHGLVKNDILESAKDAADLFTVVNEVRRIIRENVYY